METPKTEAFCQKIPNKDHPTILCQVTFSVVIGDILPCSLWKLPSFNSFQGLWFDQKIWVGLMSSLLRQHTVVMPEILQFMRNSSMFIPLFFHTCKISAPVIGYTIKRMISWIHCIITCIFTRHQLNTRHQSHHQPPPIPGQEIPKGFHQIMTERYQTPADQI